MARDRNAGQSLVNPEAERALLGRIISDETVWWNVCDELTPLDFGLAEHAATYEGMAALSRAGRSISVLTLVSQIKSSNEGYDEASIGFRLASIAAEGNTAEARRVDTAQLVSLIKHRSICRSLVGAGEKIKERAASVSIETPIEDVLADAGRLVSQFDISDAKGAERIGDLVGQVISSAEQARLSGRPRGLRVKLRCLDDLIGSVLATNLIVLAGETGSGKTALATEVGYEFSVEGKPGYMFSLEMDGAELATRIVAREASVQSGFIADGRVTAGDTERMMEAGARVLDLPFWIDSRPKPTVPIMTARLARAIARHGIQWAIIDHLQYVQADNTKSRENEQIKQVVDDIKAMAKRLRIPIFLLSHVTRQTDFSTINLASDIRRPTLNSLYGSSAIEKAADAVVFVHRPEWFLQQANPSDKYVQQHRHDLARWRGRAELVLPKLRGGKPFRVRECMFEEDRTWFSDLPNHIAEMPL